MFEHVLRISQKIRIKQTFFNHLTVYIDLQTALHTDRNIGKEIWQCLTLTMNHCLTMVKLHGQAPWLTIVKT